MKGLKELRIRLFKSSPEDLWESKLLQSLVGIQIQDVNFVIELPGIDGQEAADRLTRPISINNGTPFIIQRRTMEGDRSNIIIAPSYDPDPLSWKQAVVITICNPVAVLRNTYSEFVLKVVEKIEARERRG